jgi:hypothetical protein
MPAAGSDTDNASLANCGCRRDFGIVRTSASCWTPWALKSAMNSSIARVECPMV